jgi:ribonuclease HII
VTRRPTFEREIALWNEGRSFVAGVDEVGRGPLAGPVVAAAVVFPRGTKAIRGLRDSKILPAAQRERLARVVRARAAAVGVGAASVREIDRLNIRRATILAMQRALGRLGLVPAEVLVDGVWLPELGRPHDAIVDGDACCQSIAAASVIAKETRDRYMRRADATHPGWDFAQHVGYSTPEHRDAIERLGVSPLHRLSFQSAAYQHLSL